MSNRMVPTPTRTSGRPLQPAPPPTTHTTPYRSSSCVIGTHPECVQSSPVTAPIDVPVIYEACDCPCHTADAQPGPRQVTE